MKRLAPRRLYKHFIAVFALFCGLIRCSTTKPAPQPPIPLAFGDRPVFLAPHEHWVTALEFSPDGRWLVSGANQLLHFWDTATCELRAVRGDDSTRGYHRLAFSPDGSRLAAVGGLLGKDVVMYDVSEKGLAQPFASYSATFDFHKPFPDTATFTYRGKPLEIGGRTALAWSPDGRILATAPDSVVLRDAATGKVIRTLDQPATGVKGVAFSPEGEQLATVADDKRVRLWSLPEGALQATLSESRLPLLAVAFSPDGKRVVATGSSKRSIIDQTPVGALWMWKLPRGAAQNIDLGSAHAGPVVFVDSDTMLTGVACELWEIKFDGDNSSHKCIASMSDEILTVALSPDRKLVACGGKDRTLDVLDMSTGNLVHRLPGFMTRYSAVAASNDGKRFATATIDSRFWSNPTSKSESFESRWKKTVDDESNASRIAASEVRVWSAADGLLITALQLPKMQVTAMDFVPNSQRLAIAGWTRESGSAISLWETGSGQRVHEFESQAAEILALDVSPDGEVIAVGDAKGSVTIWSFDQGTKSNSHKFDNPIEAVTYSDDGKLLAMAQANGQIQLLDARSGETRREMKSQSPLHAIAFSPDGKLLAAGLRSKGLEMWDLRTNADGRILKAAGDYVDNMPGFVAFSADNRLVVCGGHGKDIAVFDTTNGELRCELRGHEHPATAAAFLPDGRLVSAGDEGAIRMWDAGRNRLLATWCTAAADPARHWADTWVGFRPSGEFVGPNNLDRLVGWITGGEIVIGQADNVHKRRVKNLFASDGADQAN
jgi:WD40 repeat protein